jgi:protoporphyrinogen oxidase
MPDSEVVTAADTVQVVVIGAGPAGLTAAHRLTRRGVTPTVLEADRVVGGISRTVERDGWRFDIGGHRFFTKVREVEDLWHELLGPDELLTRPRMSRIYYGGKFYDYPLRVTNALGNLGLVESARCGLSYLWARVHPPRDTTTFEGWTARAFGWRLYRTFFKTYTEKVWGVPAASIQSDFAAQRIKNLSLLGAVLNALRPRRGQTAITSLIEEFEYPRYGPGMMWERARDRVEEAGAKVLVDSTVVTVRHAEGRATSVVAETPAGPLELPCDEIISSMPLSALVLAMDPPAPDEVREAAADLRYRDFLTVALVVPRDAGFPDNWIYVHSPDVRLGRIQNFGSWSPWMVKDGRTCLGLEYFCFEGDDLWTMPDDDLVALGARELAMLDLVDPAKVEQGYVVRMPKAYPMYDERFRRNVDVLRAWLEGATPNVHPVGRNGMHRYNNQDHSMYTAMLTVENLLDGAAHDIWAVNVEEEYHEHRVEIPRGDTGGVSGVLPTDALTARPAGTGRDAPVIPRDAFGDDHPLNRPNDG